MSYGSQEPYPCLTHPTEVNSACSTDFFLTHYPFSNFDCILLWKWGMFVTHFKSRVVRAVGVLLEALMTVADLRKPAACHFFDIHSNAMCRLYIFAVLGESLVGTDLEIFDSLYGTWSISENCGCND